MKITLSFLVLCFTVLGVASGTDRPNSQVIIGDDPPLKVTAKRDDDKVQVKSEAERTLISIQCPFGISHAIIERSTMTWPDAITLRLHLKGLEKLEITNGKDTLSAAVSSHGGKTRLWKDGKENLLLDSKHPYWMKIQLCGKNGKPAKTIPLHDGYFEMQLPKALFDDNPNSITFRWIDFYR